MIPRCVTLAAAALILWALLHASVTLPALTLIGLLLWAVVASVLAVVFYLRGRTRESR